MTASYAPPLSLPVRPVSHRAQAHLRRFVAPPELGVLHDQPAHPAHVSPIHLPAMAHVASDLESLTVPIKVVPATYLGACEDCCTDTRNDLDALPAVATVVAVDAYGFRYRSEACALHLESLVDWHVRRECRVHVEVPADSTRWYERDDRETWFAVDDQLGVVVARDVLDTWTVWLHDTNLSPVPLVARMGVRGGESYADLRERAEVLAQAYASTLAADGYELASQDAVTVALPVVAVSEVAAA